MTETGLIVLYLDTRDSMDVLLTVDAVAATRLLTDDLAAMDDGLHTASHAGTGQTVTSRLGGDGQGRHDQIVRSRHGRASKETTVDGVCQVSWLKRVRRLLSCIES